MAPPPRPPPLINHNRFSTTSTLSVSSLIVILWLMLMLTSAHQTQSDYSKLHHCQNVNDCDTSPSTQNFQFRSSPSIHQKSPVTPTFATNPLNVTSPLEYIRHTRSAVINPTVSSQSSLITTTEDDRNGENWTTSTSKKSISKTPPLGFGDFHYSDDDEDYSEGTDKQASSIVRENAFHEAFDIQPSSEPELPNVDQTDYHNGFGEVTYTSEIKRIRIIGDMVMQPKKIYSMQQAIPADYEGCFCDRHFQVIKKLEEIPFESANGEHQNKPNSSSTIKEKGASCSCLGKSIIDIPNNFSLNVRKIVLKRIALTVLKEGSLQIYRNLTEIVMDAMNDLHLIEAGAFSHLPRLATIYIKMAPALRHIPYGVFYGSIPKLMHLKITHSGLEQLPAIYQAKSDQIISMIDFDNSRIHNITTRSINISVESLNIEYNQIEFVSNHAFYGSKIAKLSLKGNKKLVYLEELAFFGLSFLLELDLSQTSITKLPTMGLSQSLEVLRMTDTFTLKEIPFIYNFKNMKEAHLTYPYHCCAFQFPANHDPVEYARIEKLFTTDKHCNDKRSMELKKTRVKRDSMSNWDTLFWLPNKVVTLLAKYKLLTLDHANWLPKRSLFLDYSTENNENTVSPSNQSDIYGILVYEQKNSTPDRTPSSYELLESSFNKQNEQDNIRDSKRYNNVVGTSIGDLPSKPYRTSYADLPGTFGTPQVSITPKQEFCGYNASKMPAVRCFPKPDAFNPCEDVMGNNYLRFVVWLVAFAAVSGNVAVIVVLVSSRFTFNVSKFLMINLSIADLMMGVYLFIIAAVDIKTRGVYFNYAIDWQHGIGCKIAGFITVFAQLLSIFTLTVITLERWFAITFAIQLNRRLKLSLAVKVMITLWLFVVVMASLPLFGISSYSKTSICLPMEHKSLGDNVYLFSLLVINQLAFLLISACYIKMYVSIISQKTRATMNDKTIAKRMASLVFTDFACWAPISFFGLTAIFGYPLIDLTKSKILLVTIYPLNSCANPFLYVIFTKQYRRDFFILASRYGLCKKKAMQYKNTRHVNYYLNHHHQHHLRPNSAPNTSDLHHAQCPKSIPASGSVFSQVSCDGQNVHLYKYICKGHHHHHYCTEDNSNSHQTPESSVNNSHYCHHSHHSCSDAEQTSDHDSQIDKRGCSKCASQEMDSTASATSANKHRKHKRCHNSHPHHSRCRSRNITTSYNHTNNKDQQRYKANTGHKNDKTATCCRSAVFSTVDIYPELSNTNSGEVDHKMRRHLEQSNQCSCVENSFNENECSCQKVKVRCAKESVSMSQEASSCEKVQIVKNYHLQKCDSDNSCRVVYTKKSPNTEQSKKSNRTKRTSRLLSLMEKISFTKIGQITKGKSRSSNVTTEKDSCETSSPYSSSNSSSRAQRRHHHHHYRCYSCHPHYKHMPKSTNTDKSPSPINPLPVEEQREILRQALQETTTVQEAVAVVEELSSGTRVSSSSSSKKTTKAAKSSE